MPQYTSSATNSGVVVNTVLDTQTNTQTITVTLPTGQVATTTAPGNTQGVPTTVATSIRNQFTAQGVIFSPFAINRGIGSTTANVVNQEALASTTAVVTGNPPPAESAPIPVAPTNNPNTTPAPSVPPVENATTPATGQNAATNAALLDANAEPQQLVDPNTDPNTNIGNDSQEQPPQPQQTISLASDPNTNIGTEGQDVTGFEPLTEPPITNDGDEFSGIDEQVQRQKDLEDGSLEFAGIDDQIAANENTLQEPPLLSDDEIAQQVALAAAQEETIAPQKVPDEFDGIDAQVAANKAQADLDAQDAAVGGGGKGISTALNDTRSTATKDDSANFQQKPDWRARLSLSPGANYLYKVPKGEAGILEPLQATDGVIFPYTPGISVTYSAGYDAAELIHSNYKVYQYKGSSVDTVSITADFTAQDTTEANYLLAVIHFFRSVTKMFYGQDKNPNNGVPPPLCYLSGFGAYTFDAHPLVVTNFIYTTPTDVDYIRAGSQTNQPGVNISQQKPVLNSFVPSTVRTAMNGLAPKVPNFTTQNTMINSEATYIPTKIQLQITCIPIVTRNDISNKFSLKEYATGALLRGSKRSGGGIW
jgi:hypothetical protein